MLPSPSLCPHGDAVLSPCATRGSPRGWKRLRQLHTLLPLPTPHPPTPQFPYQRCDLLDGTRSACDFAPVGRMRGGGGGRGVGGEAADGRLGAMENPPPATSPPPAPVLHPRASARGSRLHPSSPRFAISGRNAAESCTPFPPLPRRAEMCEQHPCSGLEAALRCCGGLCALLAPPPLQREAAPGRAQQRCRPCGREELRGAGMRSLTHASPSVHPATACLPSCLGPGFLDGTASPSPSPPPRSAARSPPLISPRPPRC